MFRSLCSFIRFLGVLGVSVVALVPRKLSLTNTFSLETINHITSAHQETRQPTVTRAYDYDMIDQNTLHWRNNINGALNAPQWMLPPLMREKLKVIVRIAIKVVDALRFAKSHYDLLGSLPFT